ncbi:MAG: tol-pal system protein YbgF [Rhodanobacteraceae bacterium]|jgi:tol-pal system protein YbgF|nr:tol-pal system protein YbgF [Rhodanobacteraceae bacterium]
MARLLSHAIAAVALVATAFAWAPPAHAQRLSLAERVDRLEQQATQGGGAVDLVNQLQALQSQVQSLQGQVEELRHALDQAQQRSKDQYIDLDSRLNRIEGGAAPAAGAPRAEAPAQPPDIELGGPSATPPRTADTGTERTPTPAETGTAAPAAAGDAATVYNEAFAALKDGRYAESARRFQGFIDRYPGHDLTPNAYYWLGESYYVTQNYEVAEQAFRTLLQRFPSSQKAPDALLKIGYSQYELKQWDQAEATLNQVVQTYPDTTYARLAQGRLRALKMDTRR